jgi:EmrB/QacA subfamily drug resistance transporter
MSRIQSWILITLLLGVFMGALDIFIVVPALSSIQVGLHVEERLVTWTITAYTLILVVSQPLVSKLSDLYGRRWIYVSSVGVFAFGSLVCALSPNLGMLIAGRSIQAIGAGGVLPVASAVVADVFPEERRGMALGFIGSCYGLAFILGPLIGSWLTGGAKIGTIHTDWHAIFVVNLPLAALIILLAIQYLPDEAPGVTANIPFDWQGSILLGMGLFCLIFGLTQINFTNLAANFTNEAAFPLLIVAFFFIGLFWLNEQNAIDPLIDPLAFGKRQLIIAMLLSIMAGIVTTSITYVPTLAENEFGMPKGQGGALLTLVAITLTIGTPMVGRFLDRYGPRNVMFAGSLTTITAILLVILSGKNHYLMAVALLLLGAGLSTFVGTPLRYIVVNEADPGRRASSLSVLTVCNSVGQTLILPLGGALISSALAVANTPAHKVSATINATHIYYFIVLILLCCAVVLTRGLKSRVQEMQERLARRQTTIQQNAGTSSVQDPTAQPAMV